MEDLTNTILCYDCNLRINLQLKIFIDCKQSILWIVGSYTPTWNSLYHSLQSCDFTDVLIIFSKDPETFRPCTSLIYEDLSWRGEMYIQKPVKRLTFILDTWLGAEYASDFIYEMPHVDSVLNNITFDDNFKIL